MKKTARLTLRFSAGDMRDFARLSGDRNRLHSDDGYARARGFKGRVVYGGLLVAAVSRLLASKIPGPGCVWHSLALDFKNPLYVGERAALSARVSYHQPSLRVVRLDLEIKSAGRLIARGSAQAQAK